MVSPAPISPGPESGKPLLDPALVLAWTWIAGAAVLLPLVLDGLAGEPTGAGRIFLACLLGYHLILVPGFRKGWSTVQGIVESAALALAALPLIGVVRWMTGAAWEQLCLACGMLLVAHASGRVAGAVGNRFPGFLRFGYWPVAIGILYASPLLMYASAEFFGAEEGALVCPVLSILDGGP